MLSLWKLLTLIVMIAAVWYAFRWLRRVTAAPPPSRVRGERRRAKPETPRSGGLLTEDMVRCSVCDIYVPARGAPACARADCPLRR